MLICRKRARCCPIFLFARTPTPNDGSHSTFSSNAISVPGSRHTVILSHPAIGRAIGGVLAFASWQAAGGPGGGLWHQRVTARLGDQDGRAGGVFLDLLPQPVDVCLERVGGDAGIIAPDFLQQCLARYWTLASTTKISQDAGLLPREPHLVTLGIEQEFRA